MEKGRDIHSDSELWKESLQDEALENEPPVKPIYTFRVVRNGMEAEMEMQHGGLNTLPPLYEDMIAGLTEAGVKFGICEDILRTLCDYPVYGRSCIVARGRAPETGADGYVKFLVETERSLRPKERSDGTVDYRDLGYIQNVSQGQPICEIHAPEKGADGMDVQGNVIEGRFGKEPPSAMGKNTELSEDKTILFASCDGSVSVTRGIATVVDQLRINGNIDNSTGDINFVGDIFVKGDVIAGFNVSAKGNIVIQGSAEGAKIEATGDITISAGVNGMDRGQIIAGGSIKCKYIQSCLVKADGNIYADAVMYCQIFCGGNLELAGQRGRLIAGRTTVAGYIKAHTIGTDSHVSTVIVIDSAGDIEKDIQQLTLQIDNMNKDEVKLQQLFARIADLKQKGRMTPEMVSALGAAATNFRQLQENRTKAQQALEEAKAEQLRRQTQAVDSYIYCKARIHSGVNIQFGPLQVTLNQSIPGSRVMLTDGDIRFMSL